MGEPVTTGMMIGAASGALMNRKNPIQGAMLGGAMGAAGGSFYGGAAGATGTGGASMIGAQPAASYGGGSLAGATPTFMERASAGFSSLGSDIGGANKWMNQNPISSQLGFKLAEQAMQAPEQVPMPGGMPVQRGQIQPMDYMSLLNPQQQNVLRPAPVSLLQVMYGYF